MTLVEFLEARIDDDEEAARKTLNIPTGFTPEEWAEAMRTETSDLSYEQQFERLVIGSWRVLRECEAKWAILALLVAWDGYELSQGRVLRELARVYRDHPDYDPTWEAT